MIHTESKYSMQNVLSNVLANMDDGGEFIQPQLKNEFTNNGGEEHIMKQNMVFLLKIK